ncbi:MAG: nucleotidyl transferase AbiEii/AbiGii toxin family protein [Spirochaetales bacterium]
MTGKEASIRARLKIVAARKGVSFQYATLLYLHEGFLRRLSVSSYRERFILKGGLLLQCLSESSSRTTKDIDLLGNGIANDSATITAIVSAIITTSEDDELRFNQDSLAVEDIMEGNEYHGIRLYITCYLGNIRNTIQVDIGFGDAVETPFREIDYPILVDGRKFSMLSYPLSTVIAEKFETMVALADINSRMKDFWDVAYLLENHDIPEAELVQALKATFQKRGTPIPAEPTVFSSSFESSEAAIMRWKAFIRRSHLPDMDWGNALSIIRTRLAPIYKALQKALGSSE